METKPQVNDFVVRFANVNGTGSASTNALIAKCMFRMGLHIGPKNMFPSNIQGMPTWYEIRANKEKFSARKGYLDLMVAMNGLSLLKDCEELSPGGYFLFDSSRHLPSKLRRSDINYLEAPISKLSGKKFSKANEKILLQNMICLGIVATLLQLDFKILKELIKNQYGKKKHLLALNLEALQVGVDYSNENFRSKLPFYVKKITSKSNNNILLNGNSALALGCLYAGATVCGWYPLTPSTSIIEAFEAYCLKYRLDKETGKKKYCIIQAEDEIASLGMVLGASWNGARSFTATSGPGMSLMTEFLGYAYYAEIPAVIFNVQRCGPSTGMPTKSQQSDLLMCAYASHGDTYQFLLFPSDPNECFTYAVKAFDLADYLQSPVIVMSDLEIGMNDYVSAPISWDEGYKVNKGKVLSKDDLESLSSAYYRYEDKDDDGITARTYPGVHPKGAYFTRGSGHDRYGRYTENSELYEENMQRIEKKFKTALSILPKPHISFHKNSYKGIGLIYYGSSKEAFEEALNILAKKKYTLSSLCIKSFPFSLEIEDFIESHDKIYIVEQNRDGQMKKLLHCELSISKNKIKALTFFDGSPLQASKLANAIEKQLS